MNPTIEHNCRLILDAGADKAEATFGFEQEYTFLKGTKPLGWPENGYPSPQGPFYCGVGAERVDGRQIVEDHTQACIDAGLLIFGAEVMLGQWEFQIGYRGFEGDQNDPLTICDHVWFACWIMDRIAEDYEVKSVLKISLFKATGMVLDVILNFLLKICVTPRQALKLLNVF